MSSNICGNCANFKPKQGEKFFNCTAAKHAGVSYGMQVRADTRSCDSFMPYKAKTTPEPKPIPRATRTPPAEGAPRPAGLCRWGKAVLITALVIAVLLFSWLAYTCASNLTSKPAPTPTPIPMPSTTIGPHPTPTPMPAYTIQDFEIGENGWATTQTKMVLISGAWSLTEYDWGVGAHETAPVGTEFIIINITFINRSASTSVSESSQNFALVDSTGYVYLAQRPSRPYHVNRPFGGTIKPTDTMSGMILYLVPKPAFGFRVSYILDSNSIPPIIAQWKLPW